MVKSTSKSVKSNKPAFVVNQREPYIDITLGDFKFTNKLAAFDLDDTLIRVKSGSKFPKDENDWVLLSDNVKNKLTELGNDGFCIVIFSNQKGLSNGKQTPDTWIKKIQLIGEALKLPMRCFASIDSDVYRKPFPTLLNELTNGSVLDKASFFCGDAAGRDGDFSDSDIKFASNCSLLFKLPENLFNNETVVVPKITYSVDFDKLNYKQTDVKFVPADKEMIIMVGMPGSGKSTFVKNTLESNGYVRINMDTLKTKAKCLKECKKAIEAGKRVVIDNTNPTKDVRKLYIDMAKEAKYTVRCFKIDCPEAVAIHNSYYRSFMSEGDVHHIPMLVYRKFKKDFEEPVCDEGIKEVVVVPYSAPNSKEYRYYFF